MNLPVASVAGVDGKHWHPEASKHFLLAQCDSAVAGVSTVLPTGATRQRRWRCDECRHGRVAVACISAPELLAKRLLAQVRNECGVVSQSHPAESNAQRGATCLIELLTVPARVTERTLTG